jgi:beta-phosphoglucomutase
MKTKKAFLFDLDGVIVDTAKFHYLAWRDLAHTLGFDFTESQNEMLKGVSRVRSLEILLDIGKTSIAQDEKDRYLQEKNTKYLNYVEKMTSADVLPGVPELLNYLDSSEIPYALGSASKNAPKILEKIGLIDRFKAIVDGNQVSKAKPDPEVFLLGAHKLGFSASDCIVIEDAIAGIQAANKAGMTSIGIGDKTILYEADYVLKDMTGFTTDFLQNLIN